MYDSPCGALVASFFSLHGRSLQNNEISNILSFIN